MRQSQSAYRLRLSAAQVWLLIALALVAMKSPTHAAPPLEEPAAAQTDSALDLPLDLPRSRPPLKARQVRKAPCSRPFRRSMARPNTTRR